MTHNKLDSMEVIDRDRLNFVINLEANIVDPPQPNSKYFFADKSSFNNSNLYKN